MTEVLWTYARRARLPYVATGMGVVALAMTLTSQDRSYWIGDWRATSVAMSFPLIAILPLTSAYAAHISSRGRSTGFAHITRTMPRAGSTVRFAEWAIGAASGYFAYIAVAVVAGVLTWREAASVSPWLSYHLCAVAAIASAAAIGVWLGQNIRPRWSMISALGAALAAIFTISPLPDPVNRLLLFHTDIYGPPSSTLNPAIVRLSVAVAVSLVVLSIAWNSRHSFRYLSLLAVLTSATTLVMTPTPTEVPRTPEAAECFGTNPQVCLWREHQKWGHRSELVADKLAEVFPDVAEATYTESGLSKPEGVSFELIAPNKSDAAIAASLLRPSLPSPADMFSCDREVRQEYIVFKGWLMTRATGESFGVDGVDADVMQILDMPESTQDKWAAQAYNGAVNCIDR